MARSFNLLFEFVIIYCFPPHEFTFILAFFLYFWLVLAHNDLCCYMPCFFHFKHLDVHALIESHVAEYIILNFLCLIFKLRRCKFVLQHQILFDVLQHLEWFLKSLGSTLCQFVDDIDKWNYNENYGKWIVQFLFGLTRLNWFDINEIQRNILSFDDEMVNSILENELILLNKGLSKDIIFDFILSQRELACSRFRTWAIIRIQEVISVFEFIKIIVIGWDPKCHLWHIIDSVFITCTKPIIKNLRQEVFTKWYPFALIRKIIIVKILEQRINFGCFVRQYHFLRNVHTLNTHIDESTFLFVGFNLIEDLIVDHHGSERIDFNQYIYCDVFTIDEVVWSYHNINVIPYKLIWYGELCSYFCEICFVARTFRLVDNEFAVVAPVIIITIWPI